MSEEFKNEIEESDAENQGSDAVDIELTQAQLDEILEELGDKKDTLDDVPDRLFQDRNIYINSVIEPETIDEIVPLINYYNMMDDLHEIPVDERTFIKIRLNTQGGCAYSALNIYEEIKASKTPVKMILSGVAMSAGVILFLSTPHREMKETATLLYHEGRSETSGGTIQEMERINVEFKRLQRIYDNLIIEETNITQKMLNKYNSKVKDWYINKSDAVKYGFVKK